ncbi:MAG: glycosyltransferase family 2 protein [Patescibacteria group bacterium]|nr:glycosyltransferase family 2 protein [Patescibacteria group bacterium]
MKLSIIIPVFNEEKTIKEIIKRVNKVKLDKEIIIINDGSIDGTAKQLKQLKQKNLKIITHFKNQGKGSAIRTGLKYVKGDIVIIQDADLEYNPNDYFKLIQPIKNGLVQAVYGSRNLSDNISGKKIYKYGGIFLSWLASLLYGIKITDEATCYKAFKTDVIKGLDLRCKRFDFCPEVTAKLAKQKYEIVEVPISYYPRSHEEGKKITIRDGLKATWILIKYRFFDY